MDMRFIETINKLGYIIFAAAVPISELNQIIDELAYNDVFQYENNNSGHNLLSEFSSISTIAVDKNIIEVVKGVIGQDAIPLKAIIIDKTKQNNWGLDWHQDLKIAVQEKDETPGFTQWTQESGINHVIPTIDVLQRSLTVRIHLDDCNPMNGSIWVLPGTHKGKIYSKDEIVKKVKEIKIVDCIANKGEVMFMSPLLLHKSPYSLTDKSRRVLQIEYSSVTLPNNLIYYT
jgi:ectoine hydroxylase-related dioxygenase (phytanoyl-CoA dioxygenase family)